MKQTTMDWVKDQLLIKGKVTRNQAIRLEKTHRLAEYIRLLRAELSYPYKYYIIGHYKKTKNGKDFVYELEYV